MPADDLEKALKSIHDSLDDASQIDADMVQKLRTLVDDIHLAIAKSPIVNEPAPTQATLTNRLNSLITDFEIRHPTLTTNLSLIAERLADMGI